MSCLLIQAFASVSRGFPGEEPQPGWAGARGRCIAVQCGGEGKIMQMYQMKRFNGSEAETRFTGLAEEMDFFKAEQTPGSAQESTS